MSELERAAHVPLPPSVSSLDVDGFSIQERYELQHTGSVDFRTTTSVDSLSQRNVSSLAPTDGGFRAWSFLAAAFVIEAVVWAFPTSFGVLLSAYMRETKLTSQPNASEILPLIGTFSSGIIYCSGPLICPFLHRYPKQRRTCFYIGLLLCCTSLFGASYATNVRSSDLVRLSLCHRRMYACFKDEPMLPVTLTHRKALLYAPCISFMSEWFVRKRGLANGVMFAGTAAGGLCLPLIFPVLVNSFGPSKTLRILSLAVLLFVLPGLPFLRPRLPENRVHAPGSRPLADHGRHQAWMRNPCILYVLANTLQGLAYFLPLLWLPTFASELNPSDSESSLTVALLNGASVLSRVGMGLLSDKFSPWILALATTLCTSLATFVFWGVLSRNLVGVLAFGISYGALAGGWSSLFTGFTKPITSRIIPRYPRRSFGIFMLSRGIGNILSTFISTALSDISAAAVATGNTTISSSYPSSHPSLGFNVGDGRYTKMIVYVGTCFAGAGFIALIGWGLDVYGTRSRRRIRQQINRRIKRCSP